MSTWAVQGILDHVVTRDIITPKNPDGVVRIACLGDSNTAEPGAFFSAGDYKWPNYLRSYLGRPWQITNYALGGGFITNPRSLLANASSEGYVGAFVWAGAQMVQALASSCDVAIIAFGTNDVVQAQSSTAFIQTINQGFVNIVTSFRAAGVTPFLCACPPRPADANSSLLACTSLFALFAATSMHAVKVDLFTNVASTLTGVDGIHYTPAGHMLRADRIFRALHENPV